MILSSARGLYAYDPQYFHSELRFDVYRHY